MYRGWNVLLLFHRYIVEANTDIWQKITQQWNLKVFNLTWLSFYTLYLCTYNIFKFLSIIWFWSEIIYACKLYIQYLYRLQNSYFEFTIYKSSFEQIFITEKNVFDVCIQINTFAIQIQGSSRKAWLKITIFAFLLPLFLRGKRKG